jgi:hypothetical protein
MGEDRPLADLSRVELALHLFPYREVSAEEWAARGRTRYRELDLLPQV